MPRELFAQSVDVVSALRQGLAERIGQQRFDLWFGPQIQWQIVSDAVIVSAPNSFMLDCLRRQFSTEIRDVLQTVCPDTTRAEFRVNVGECSSIPTESSSPSSPSVPVPAVSQGFDLSAEIKDTAAGGTALKENGVSAGTGVSSRPAGPAGRARSATLASFIVGQSNRLAYTSVQAVIKRTDGVSPVFLFGPPGTGKTHLLEGVCSAVRASEPRRRVLFLTAEQFTCHFLEALQGSGLPNFRRKCREVDLLVIDDLHFLASGKKTATLLEFQHTMDALSRHGRQLLVAADRAPTELAAFGNELMTRLTGGLVSGLSWADYETRLEMTRRFVDPSGPPISLEVMRMIAAETCGDARQIRGALNRLRAVSQAFEEPITLELARESLRDLFACSHRPVRLPDVERAVCEVFGMESKSLREGGKTKSISQPRMLAMWLARKYTRAAFSEIGEYFGRRSHSTVISAENKVNHWLADGVKLQLGATAWQVDEALRRIESRLRTG